MDKPIFMALMFKEKQGFTQWWLWVILLGTLVLPFIFRDDFIFTFSAANLQFMLPYLIIVGGFIGLFLIMRLKTEIDQEEIRMQLTPFIKKRIKWEDVRSAEVLNYGFVGGWGIRLWTSYGTVYNVKGNKGLALELSKGQKLLIGTQKERELKKVLTKLNHSPE